MKQVYLRQNPTLNLHKKLSIDSISMKPDTEIEKYATNLLVKFLLDTKSKL